MANRHTTPRLRWFAREKGRRGGTQVGRWGKEMPTPSGGHQNSTNPRLLGTDVGVKQQGGKDSKQKGTTSRAAPKGGGEIHHGGGSGQTSIGKKKKKVPVPALGKTPSARQVKTQSRKNRAKTAAASNPRALRKNENGKPGGRKVSLFTR